MSSRFLLFALFFLAFVSANGQTEKGSYQPVSELVSFSDTFYTQKTIKAQLFYPSTNGQTVADGRFTMVVFGHGLAMSYLDYNNICNHLASWGFLVMSPDVQNGITGLDHLTYAKEMAACIRYMETEDLKTGSKLNGHVGYFSAAMGHSMGGGAAQLVPSVFNRLTCIVSLAAGETNPSAIEAAKNTTIPVLHITAEKDGVTPEATNQIPMYENATGKKMWISIKNAGHCEFADKSTICDIAAATTPDAGTLSFAEQQSIANRYTTAFYRAILQDIIPPIAYLCGDSIAKDSRVVYQENFCLASRESETQTGALKLYPNPAQDWLFVPVETNVWSEPTVTDIRGQRVKIGAERELRGFRLNISQLPAGVYVVEQNGITARLVKK